VDQAGGRGAAVPACAPDPEAVSHEGERVTIAPAEPVSVAVPEEQDQPGSALLTELTALTADLPATEPGRVAASALRGRHAGSDAAELRSLAIEAAAGLIADEPQYSRLAARLLTLAIREEAAGQGAVSFSESGAVGHRGGGVAAPPPPGGPPRSVVCATMVQ
jgi:ribonucleoside-diphosphate reductase alpha chain